MIEFSPIFATGTKIFFHYNFGSPLSFSFFKGKYFLFGIFLVRIQSECKKIQTRKSPNTDTSRSINLIWSNKNYSIKFYVSTIKSIWSKFRQTSYITWLFLYTIIFIVEKNEFRRNIGCNCHNYNFINERKKGKEKRKKYDQWIKPSVEWWSQLGVTLLLFFLNSD